MSIAARKMCPPTYACIPSGRINCNESVRLVQDRFHGQRAMPKPIPYIVWVAPRFASLTLELLLRKLERRLPDRRSQRPLIADHADTSAVIPTPVIFVYSFSPIERLGALLLEIDSSRLQMQNLLLLGYPHRCPPRSTCLVRCCFVCSLMSGGTTVEHVSSRSTGAVRLTHFRFHLI